MKIDWFSVIAQVINFLILVWLLKHFLYKPILDAVDEREKKIASQLKDAKADKEEAKKQQDELTKKNDTFDKQKKELMDKAVTETKEQREKLLEEARADANKLSEKLDASLKAAQENISHEIAQKTQEEVFAITRKTLADLASVSLEEQAVSTFTKRLNELKEAEKKKLVDAFTSDSKPVLIRSAFNLPHKQQVEIKDSIKEILGAKTHFEFSTVPELISGIELTANGFKLAWSISEYLNSMKKNISEITKEKSKKELEKKVEHKKKIQSEKDTESDEITKSETKAHEEKRTHHPKQETVKKETGKDTESEKN